MNEHAAALGKLGGRARARATTSAQRKAWARKAGKASGLARARKILSPNGDKLEEQPTQPTKLESTTKT